MTTFNCPHCGKSIGLSVIGHQSPTPTPTPTQTTPPPTPTPTPTSTSKSKPLVTTQQALNMKSGITVEGKIEGKSPTKIINKKAGGTIDLCEAELVDESGRIKVQFWGDEVNKIQNGLNIRITNGYTNSFKGDITLTKGKYGSMEILA